MPEVWSSSRRSVSFVAARVEVGEPLRDVVVEGELPFVAELQDGDGGELLGDGADLEHRVHRQRNVPFDVRLAVALEEQGVVAPDDGGGDADGAILEDSRAGERVELLDERGTIGLMCV